MKKYFLLLLLVLCICGNLHSQGLKYSYDEAGNRIKRELVVEPISNPIKPTQSKSSDIMKEKDIHIYPNPTEGMLRVEIVGLMDDDNCSLMISDITGRTVLTCNVSMQMTDLDISAQPKGIYILSVTLNGGTDAWKIIKK